MPAKKAAKKTATKQAKGNDAPVRSRTGGGGELARLRTEINAKKGPDTVMTGNTLPPARHIPTGSFLLDLATMGGIPERQATMLYGYESSGKTAVLMRNIAEFQRKYPKQVAVLIDAEHMYDPLWAAQLGVDTSRLEVARPETGEEAVDVFIAMMECLEVGYIALDSVPTCVPQVVVERSAEDDTMASLARLMGKFCSKVLTTWGKERKRGHYVTVAYINQFRSKVGLVFGDPRTLPGGRQINHLPTTKIELKGDEVMGEDSVGNNVSLHNKMTFKVTKAKNGCSIRSGEVMMVMSPDNEHGMPTGAYDDYKTVLVYAQRFGLLTGAGANYRLDLLGYAKMKLGDIERALRRDQGKFDRLKACMIVMQRVSKNLPPLPPDNFLVGPGVTVPAEFIAVVVRDHERKKNAESPPAPAVEEDDGFDDSDEEDEAA